MAVSAKVGAFNVNDGGASVGNTFSITVGFAPTCIICWWAGHVSATDANAGQNAHTGVGFGVSTTDRRAMTTFIADAAATTDTGSRQDAAAVVVQTDGAGAAAGALDIQSVDANGYTFIIDVAFATNLRVHYLALGGDVSSAIGGALTIPASTGNLTETGLGFTPKAVLLCALKQSGETTGGAGGAALSLGAATGTANEAVIGVGSTDAAANVDSGAYGFGDECYARLNDASGGIPVTKRAEFVSFASGEFTINVLESSVTTNGVFYLALGGAASFRVGDFLTRTDTTQFAQSGFGFQPAAVLFGSVCRAESTQDASTAHWEWSVGAATSATERGAQASTDQDALADSEVWSAVEHDEVYVNGDLADGVEGLMDLVSMDADGFTTVMDDADPTTNFVWYLAIGVAAVGGQNPDMRVSRHMPRGELRGADRGVI